MRYDPDHISKDNVELLPMNAKLGQIMRIMEINIWLLETLFILSIQIFDMNI